MKAAAMFAILVALNAVSWIWAGLALHHYPLLMGTALLAYTLGLRHAVDADHIAAIDNVTRKLMHQGQRPLAVGLYFSFGHSTVVFALSLLIAAASFALNSRFSAWAGAAGIFGTCVSATFLLGIAGANLVVLAETYRKFQDVKNGRPCEDDGTQVFPSGGGLFGRFARSAFGLINRSSQMYLVGLLFGLGFDTATEVGLLGISAKEAASGLNIWSILIFPTLFTCGMALVDTADGIAMLGAYEWAFINPIRKLYYNLTMIAVSVAVAVLVGGIEILGIIQDHWKTQGHVWDVVAQLNGHFGLVGFAVLGIFVCMWATSIAIYRLKGFDQIRLREKAPLAEL
jgi:high-affinity nickel-transport protein